MNVVAIIPARGGSKGVPGKNIKEIGGKPLLYYTIKAALDAKTVDRIIVSTDDEKIAKVAKECGAEVPFIRPAEFANDTATSESVLTHAIDWLKENEDYEVDIIVYLQVTDAFRKKGMIDTCVQKLIDDDKLESAFVAYSTHKKFWKDGVRLLDTKKHDPRQKEKHMVLREDTGIACATRPSVLEKGARLGDNVWILENDDPLSGIDINDPKDFWLAKTVIEKLQEENDDEYYFND